MNPAFPMRGDRIQALRAARAHELVLETHGAGGRLRRWSVSADPEHARWIETFSAPRPPALPGAAGTAPFLLLARARLAGGRVADVDSGTPGIVRLTCETEQGPRSLLLELFQPGPNLLLLDADERVEGTLRAVPSARKLNIGQTYSPPDEATVMQAPLPRTPPSDPGQARALDARWAALLASADLARGRAVAGRLTRQAVTRLERRLAHLDQDRRAADEADRFRRWGDLLKIFRDRWHPGATELRVPDEFAPERPETAIPLNPALTLAGNIAALFRQYRKRQAASAHVQRRLAETRKDLSAARSAAEGVALAQSLPDIERAMRALPGWQRSAHAGPGPGARRPQDRTAARSMQRASSDGMTILVGRSAQDNEALTFRMAKGRDWWLHAVGFPGSHVVVRNPAGGALPLPTLREAAWLAAYYSKARPQGRVEVVYVERKHVRRMPKGKPGEVIIAHGQTLWVDIADAQLSRILGAMEPVRRNEDNPAP